MALQKIIAALLIFVPCTFCLISSRHYGWRKVSSIFARDRAEQSYYYSDNDLPSPRRYLEDSSTDYWQEDEDERYQEDPLYDVQRHLDRETIEWERCETDAGTVHVLLPPLSVDKPSTVLHFVGGTFFGSAPALWYKQFLEDIVKNTNAAVVASTIPVTLLQSPLQHVRLAKQIQRQFQIACRDVLEDEYGPDVKEVPVCAVGHSLGSRLLVVMSTLGTSSINYKAFVIISFTNYGAAAGIPGIYQLNKVSRRLEKQRENQRYAVDDDDDDWGDIVSDLQDLFREQTARVKTALTPQSKDLEFYPSPDQLWKAITEGKRYQIPETLIVQFDDDEVDQSAKLAETIKSFTSVKFARLRGTHLTPVSTSAPDRKSGKVWLNQLNSQVGSMLWRILSGRRQLRSNEEALRDLRQSIARYISEVVTK